MDRSNFSSNCYSALKYLFVALMLGSATYAQTHAETEYYRKGMVVSAHPLASEVGLQVLKKGGNAVDAAVAVQFALAVVFPEAGNIGGGGFMVYRSNKGETASLDFREKAPARASRNMYLDEEGNAVTDRSLYGHLAAGVPGTVDGMVEAHKRYGKLLWKDLVQPAVELAANGFELTSLQAEELNSHRLQFQKYNPRGTPLVKQEREWRAGDRLVQTDLAHSLELIRDKGREGFYGGKLSEYLVKEMNRGRGLITRKDLQDYKSVWRKPVTGHYKNFRIVTMPPPSSGGIALLQLLHAVEPYPLKKWGQNQDSTVQLIVEAERRVYADRATYLGDPDFYKVPENQLLAPAYTRMRMSDFSWDKATPSKEVKAGKLLTPESEETTHYSIVDQQGNAVSVTTTLNGAFGSMVMVEQAGFLLNNEMDDFSVKPGTPNMYGLIGGEANSIAPGKRMLSSMTPTIIERDGKLFMVVGTPGGSTIITSVFQTILNVIEFGQTMQDAVNARRFHHQWLPDLVFTEPGALSASTEENLKKKGFGFSSRGGIGRMDAILVTPQGYSGGADNRGNDTAMGW